MALLDMKIPMLLPFPAFALALGIAPDRATKAPDSLDGSTQVKALKSMGCTME